MLLTETSQHLATVRCVRVFASACARVGARSCVCVRSDGARVHAHAGAPVLLLVHCEAPRLQRELAIMTVLPIPFPQFHLRRIQPRSILLILIIIVIVARHLPIVRIVCRAVCSSCGATATAWGATKWTSTAAAKAVASAATAAAAAGAPSP
jgi:hypothetical protein